MRPEEEWEWDVTAEMVKDKVFELSGPNNSIATKIDWDKDSDNCMMVGRAMGAGTGKHTISMKLDQGSANGMYISCGMVSDGALWYIVSDEGDICKLDSDYIQSSNGAGEIKSGQVLTMQVDTDARTLKFWVDGKPHGPGYTSGVTGPLRWATSVGFKGNAVEIVPTPELEYES